MNLIGQRWEYCIGNSIVHVDNAFSWALWAQERMSVNFDVVYHSSGYMRFRQSYHEPWLTTVGEEQLMVTLQSKLRGIACSAVLGTEPLTVHAMFAANWQGTPNQWPAEDVWQPRRSAWAAADRI